MYGYRDGRSSAWKMRLILAAVIAGISLISYLSMSQQNPITGENQRVALSPNEEIALGLQAAPELVHQHQGMHPDADAQATVDRIGTQLLMGLDRELAQQGRSNPYRFEFHLLRDSKTVNAFALPGGQVFITAALYERLETEGQLAGVLGHEIGHVLSRHGAQALAKQRLTQGLAGAAGVAGGDVDSARMAQAIGALVNLQYGRDAELESDRWGVRLMAKSGYDPRAMAGVMKILEEASGGAGGQPEFLSSHPKPANRVAYIESVIKEQFPNGVPEGLKP
jgi:beta-barrel assembly-enhancing protease